ncbi:ABC transporter substrate-binding protein [Azospirillum rugosum]|uniref:Spermidine/putrescine transport system substrate-binding protein n=1 Tax=Azospirillum rugosum TaxID=416170 RepID=A0ABS4SUF9_9PROT|nr:ABC transporter substrate-binding protein [Azospirillum rugosum]MBP2296203.1 putative spermidine/putrescine transport system substrate-binding protein [Azospirillum rugosum]MDQ0527112.1 putative spermidine/putrescine transport system substrate-binding protein [Azospirillum rugosum]
MSKASTLRAALLSTALLSTALLSTALVAGFAGTAAAQSKTLYIGMNGGTMEKTYTEHVFPAFEKATGAKVVVVPGTSSDILAKLQAQKDNPQMHVVFLDDGLMYRAMGMGLCQKTAASPVLDEVYPTSRLKGDMAVGVNMGMTGLAYNTKMFQEKGWAPPTSWMDLADAKYKGKVVVQSAASSSFGLHAFLMFNRIQGGTEANVDPGFKAWRGTIGQNVLEYIPSSAKISEMVQTGEAAMFPLTPTAVGALKDKGIPVEYAQPKEGSAVLMVAECVVANNSEPDLSQKLAAFLLGAEAQAKALEFGSQIPSNTTVKPTAETAKLVETFQGYMKNAVLVDWDVINEKRPEWNQRWNKEIER